MNKILNSKFIYCPKNGLLEDHSIIIKKNKIFSILPKKLSAKIKYPRIRLGNSIIIPGFVNAHIHLELNWVNQLLQPFSDFPSWLKQIIELKKNNNQKKMVRESVAESLLASIDSGVTTVGQISSYDGEDIQEIKKSKIRCAYFFEIANSKLKIASLKKIRSKHKSVENSLINFRLFPHSIYSLDTASLIKIFKIAGDLKIGLGIHLSESNDEVKFIKGLKNKFDDKIFQLLMNKPLVSRNKNFTPLSYLKKLNLLNHNPTLIHMNNISPKDKLVIEKHNLPITVCPRSNLFLNEKMPDIKFLINRNNIGLGTDGLSSNHSLNFLDEIRFLYLISKKILKNKTAERIIEIATLGGAKCLNLEEQIGTIENGKLADLIAFKIKSKDPLSSIINASNKDIKLKMINGEVI